MPGKLARASLALALILLIGAALARPARATLGRPLADQGPTEVRVMMIVLDIDEIDAVAQSFIANVYYEARWHDPRLAHPGPQERVVPLNEIWHPRLQYLNQQRTIQTLPAIADIQPDGEVIVRQRVWGPFSQALEVEDFPFDQHRFSVVLIAAGFEADEVLLVVDPQHASAISRELSVPDWAISELSAGPVEHRFYEGAPPIPAFSAAFEAKRHSSYFLLKVIAPLVFILAMSWTVFWLDPSLAGTQIGVATTSMLTLIAYRFTIDGYIPKVAYLTRLDSFILASTILVFVALVLAVLTSYLAANGEQSRAVRIERHCRWILPAFSAATFLFSFV